MSTLIATHDIPGEDVRAGRTRVVADHELVRRHPSAWKRDAYTDTAYRGRGLPPVNGRPDEPIRSEPRYDPLTEIAIRERTIAEMDERDRRDAARRQDGHEREFWAATERFLERLADPDEHRPLAGRARRKHGGAERGERRARGGGARRVERLGH